MQGIKRKRRCQSQCKQHIFSLKYLKTSSKYDIKMNFCPKYQRQPLPPQQTFAQFNNDRLYYTSAFVIGIDKKIVAKNLQKEMLDHQKLIKQCCEKYNPVIFPRPNSKHFLCSVCKQNYKNYYVHIFSSEHSYKVNQNNYNDSIKQLCQNFRQLWDGAQQLADEQQERRKQELQMELNGEQQDEFQDQQVADNEEEQNEENKFQNGYRQYSQQKQIVLKKIQSAVTSKPKQLKQKQTNKKSNAPFLFQELPKKKACLNDRTALTIEYKKRKQIQNAQLSQDKLQKTVPNNQQAFINARDEQQQKLKQLLAKQESKDPRLQRNYQKNIINKNQVYVKKQNQVYGKKQNQNYGKKQNQIYGKKQNQIYGKKQNNEFQYRQYYLQNQQRFKKQRNNTEQKQYINSKRYVNQKRQRQQSNLHKHNLIQQQNNRYIRMNQTKTYERNPSKKNYYQSIDLVESNSRNLANDSNQERNIQNDRYRSKSHHDAEDSKKSVNQISNRSRNAQLSRKMSDNFKDKNLPFQNPYYKYPSYYPPHQPYSYGAYCPPSPYGIHNSRVDYHRKYNEREKLNQNPTHYDSRIYYPAWQPPPQYCMPPPVIVESSTHSNQNIKSQPNYSTSYPFPSYLNNNFRAPEYSSHQFANAHRQGPNTSININFPMYMGYPPSYYQTGHQPARYPASLGTDSFSNNQAIGPPHYSNFQEPPFYYEQRSSYSQKKQYRQEKR